MTYLVDLNFAYFLTPTLSTTQAQQFFPLGAPSPESQPRSFIILGQISPQIAISTSFSAEYYQILELNVPVRQKSSLAVMPSRILNGVNMIARSPA